MTRSAACATLAGRMAVELGPYRLHAKIGVGGMAEVFKATQAGVGGFERHVAIKRILPHLSQDEEFVRMFVEEAKIAVQLSHPNIAAVLDLGQHRGSYYIALEYVHGRDMHAVQKAQAGRRLPISVVVHVAMKVCEALEHAYNAEGAAGRLDLIHRDISPPNILASYEGQVKVIDFGLAKCAGRTVETRVGVVKGKLAYMSPEQAHDRPIDHRSDIFSLGVCMWEWVTGKRLFLRDNDVDTLLAIRKPDVPSLRSVDRFVPEDLDRIVMKALAVKKEDRWQSAHELYEALEELAYTSGTLIVAAQLRDYMHQLFPDESAVPTGEHLIEHRHPPLSDMDTVDQLAPLPHLTVNEKTSLLEEENLQTVQTRIEDETVRFPMHGSEDDPAEDTRELTVPDEDIPRGRGHLRDD